MADVERRLRVAVVHPNARLGGGGAERFTVEIARHLEAHYAVELVTGEPWAIPRARSGALLRHPAVSFLWRWATAAPELWLEHLSALAPCLAALAERPPALLLPNNDVGGLLLGSALRALRGTPFMHVEHSGLLWNGRVLVRALRFKPDRLVVLTEEVAERVRAFAPDQPLSVIANGVDLARFTPTGERHPIGLARPLVLCVAALLPEGHKRVELAIRAVARLPRASLLVVGDGPDRERIAQLGTEWLGPERFAVCAFPPAAMGAVYRAADAFTLPSVDEPFGLAYLEAMACGLPVVATADRSREQIVGEGGVLCDVTDPDAYAGALATVLADDWSERARRQAERFGWVAVARAYRDAIEATLATRPPRRDHTTDEQRREPWPTIR